MPDLMKKCQEYNRKQKAAYDAVMRGECDPPPCFTCKVPSSYVSTRITPAGYHAWQCDAHGMRKPAPLWGSDPGWQTFYEPIAQAQARNQPR